MGFRESIVEPAADAAAAEQVPCGGQALQRLLSAPAPGVQPQALPSVVLGELVCVVDDGCTAFVTWPGQPGGMAVRARTVVDLHGRQGGQPVTLVFESGDADRPIVTGVVRASGGPPQEVRTAQVEVDADGRRLVLTASEQLVLRCGNASITLTRAGKVLIQGSYVSSHATGANRIKGGSVQIN
ncbi:MAG: DUF6484 domain-containing protein [Pseudorhodoferax sp.]